MNAGFGNTPLRRQNRLNISNGSRQEHPHGSTAASNGHPNPTNVKYWNIGKEMYGYWRIGHTYLRYYALKHNFFAKAMRKADPSITILACGAMRTMTRDRAHLATGKTQARRENSTAVAGLFDGQLQAIFDRLSRGRAGQTPQSNSTGDFGRR